MGIHWAPENCSIDLYDMSGQTRYRNLWPHYYPVISGLIFVVDLSDKNRMSIVHEELQGVLTHPEIVKKKIPLLLMANKIDLPDAEDPDDLRLALQLEHLAESGLAIKLIPTNGVRGDGVKQGIDWLAGRMRQEIYRDQQAHEQGVRNLQRQ